MALVNCPECSKEISDTAGKCPHCGYTLPKQKRAKNSADSNKQSKSRMRNLYIGFVLLGVGAIICFAIPSLFVFISLPLLIVGAVLALISANLLKKRNLIIIAVIVSSVLIIIPFVYMFQPFSSSEEMTASYSASSNSPATLSETSLENTAKTYCAIKLVEEMQGKSGVNSIDNTKVGSISTEKKGYSGNSYEVKISGSFYTVDSYGDWKDKYTFDYKVTIDGETGRISNEYLSTQKK